MAKGNLDTHNAKMREISIEQFPGAKVGETIRVRIPDVDRARSDSRNCLAVIIAVQNDQFDELGTKHKKLSQFYSRNECTICEEKIMRLDKVPDVKIFLWGYAKKASLCGGQGYKRCLCKGKCTTKKCVDVKIIINYAISNVIIV